MVAGVWVVIALIVIVVVVILKIANEKQAVAVKLLLVLFIFMMLTAGYVVVSQGVDLTTYDGLVHAAKIYFSWLSMVFSNVKGLTSYVIHQDWGINITNSTAQ